MITTIIDDQKLTIPGDWGFLAGFLDAIRLAGVCGEVKVFRWSESQIARDSGRVGMSRRMAQNGVPTHEIERQGRWKQGGGMVGRYTRGESAGSGLQYL